MFGDDKSKYRYEVVDGFFRRPKWWGFVEVADVDIDSQDNVYVFNRSSRPVMIFDKQGNFLDAWGEMSPHYFTLPHGISIGPDGSVFTADAGDHTVRKWTSNGKSLMTLGRARRNSPEYSGQPFNKPSGCAVASNGDLYVSDGYGNAHVHCYDSAGTLKFSWGGHGGGPGEFDLIHSVFVDRQDGDKVYIADRYNNRVQFFTSKGEFLGQWKNLLLPNSVRRGRDGNFYIAEMDHRITVCNSSGAVLARWGEGVEVDDTETGRGDAPSLHETSPANELDSTQPLPTAPSRNPMIKGAVTNEPGPGLFCAPHGIAVDSEGSIYVADVAESLSGLDRGSRCIQKFVRV